MKKLIAVLFLSVFYFSCSFNNPFLPSALNENENEIESKTNDYVFIIDQTGSMMFKMPQIKSSIISMITYLKLNNYDNKYAFIIFSDYPELLLNWTDDVEQIQTAIDSIDYPGFSEEALESLRISLNSAVNNTLVNAIEPLKFRENARKKVFLFTDEYSAVPYYIENRFLDQTTPDPPSPFPVDPNNGWCIEITSTAEALTTNNASLYLFIDAVSHSASKYQFSDPELQFQNIDYTNFDSKKTLDNLINNGLGECLQAKLLKRGKFCRAINIKDFESTDNDFIINNVLIPSVNE